MLRGISSGLVLLFGLCCAVSAQDRSAQGHTKDSLDTVKQGLAEKKAILVDVRELDEWNEGHIKNAIFLPMSQLRQGVSAEKLKELLPEGKIVYLHCAAGGRCLKAADLLKDKGYDLRPLKPGYEALVKAGFEKAPK
ncbi:MAG TPA: rhodanese-like domain-containing protein [Gemmatales bacterium]|nr:rhodanese-like domain-containing protein [Gemmatales bacterium]HMP16762.1 rhodanese-like domain-containing protein [Gemmatales bacterium]